MSEKKEKSFPFEVEANARFHKWTGISSPDIAEAIRDITGDTYFEMRKLISILLTEVERLIDAGLYSGYNNGKELTDSEKKNLKEANEDLKNVIRLATEESWRSILNKQKIGVDKMAIALKPYLKSLSHEDQEVNIPSDSDQ